jgi:hypothetical protein
MATFGEMRTKFLARLRRRDCTDELADGFLLDAIQRVQRVLRIPAMERVAIVTLNDESFFDNSNRLFLPSDYLQMVELSVVDPTGQRRKLMRKTVDEVLSLAVTTDATPVAYAREGGSLLFGPTPSDGTSLYFAYVAEFAELEEDDDENVISDIADDLIVYGALSYGCDHFNDKRGQAFEARFVQALSDLQQQADIDELTAGAQVALGFTYPCDDE